MDLNPATGTDPLVAFAPRGTDPLVAFAPRGTDPLAAFAPRGTDLVYYCEIAGMYPAIVLKISE